MYQLNSVLREIKNCQHCLDSLPYGTRPILQAKNTAKILIVGQAPGIKVHKTGIPWNDRSGDRLRYWMNVSSNQFYDANRIAIVPMGFCYPGRAINGGDNPPKRECAPKWHLKLLTHLKNVSLTLLVGKYAQSYYLDKYKFRNMSETVKSWRLLSPKIIPTPHPSWRNTHWLKKNPWFEQELVPELRRLIQQNL